MASVNKVVLVCTLGKDPEVRQTQNGTAICNISAATSRKYKDAQGNAQEETEGVQQLTLICNRIWRFLTGFRAVFHPKKAHLRPPLARLFLLRFFQPIGRPR